MRRIVSLQNEELKDIIDKTSSMTHITQVIIEKDLWNCYFLDYLFNRSKYRDFYIFKGGTSLSKCYKMIDRYSEDLDIVLDSKILKINLEEKIETLTSRNQKEKFINRINNEAMDFIEKILIPEMTKECEKEVGKELIFRLNREELAFYVKYPSSFSNEYIKSEVKIEMSSLSAIIPTEMMIVEPYTNEVANDIGKILFNIKCMMPKRTFWEKALILHQEANRVSGDFPQRYSRHYYDLYKIYNSSIWNETINDIKLLDEVRKFTMTFYNRS